MRPWLEKSGKLSLKDLPLTRVWGIGSQTTAYLEKLGLETALQFARKPKLWVEKHLTKPHVEIWQELRGESVYPIEVKPKPPQSITKSANFYPASNQKSFVFAQLAGNIRKACARARRHHLVAKKVAFFIKTNQFQYQGKKVKLSYPHAFFTEITKVIRPFFDRLFNPKICYRATGVILSQLQENTSLQLNLFNPASRVETLSCLYRSLDKLKIKHGPGIISLGSELPLDKKVGKKRINLPFLGKVS